MSTEQTTEPHEVKSTRIAMLVARFMAEVERVADAEDWKESDGWVGRILLQEGEGEGQQSYVYEIRDGKMHESDSEGPFVATIRMWVVTFLDLIEAALAHQGEAVFEAEYAAGHISYDGERWIVDSERFREVFKRLGVGSGSKS